jgi:hypothetical protein
MGKTTSCHTLLFAITIQFLYFVLPMPGEAITRWNGHFFLEDTKLVTPEKSSNLFQGGINLDVKPQTKKQISTRINARINFRESDKEWTWDISPFGSLGFDLTGESYSFNVQHSNYATLSATADLVETTVSRAAFILAPRDLPRLVADYSTSTTETSGEMRTESQTDNFSLFGDYRYQWISFRGGYSQQERFSLGEKTSESDAIFLGTGGIYEIMPMTILSGMFDINQSTNHSLRGLQTTSTGKALGLNINSSPLAWLGLIGNFRRDVNDFNSGAAAVSSTIRQHIDLTGRIYPFHNLQLATTVGNRKFDDAERTRSVDYWTVAAAFTDRLREEIQMGVNVSRTNESDPDQGNNTRDNLGVNTIMDLAPGVSLRANLNIGRSENPGFASTRVYDASGTFDDRSAFDDRPAGFTFFDSLNNELYTKKSPTPGDWSEPVPFDPITEQFSVSKTLQLNMIPTDKTSLAFSFSSNFTDEKLDILELGNRSVNSSLSYRPNLRTSYSVTGSASMPHAGNNSYAGTMSMAYRFFRGHQMNLSYRRNFTPLKTTDNFTGGLRFSLRKRTSLDLTYSSAQVFRDEQTYSIRARMSKSF